MSAEPSPVAVGDLVAVGDVDQQRREMSLRYRRAHTRGAARVRWDAYDLACLYIFTGRGEQVTPKAIHALINGGRCLMSPVRAAIADARRDCAAANPNPRHRAAVNPDGAGQ